MRRRQRINPRIGEVVYLPDDYDGGFSHPHTVAAVEKTGLTTVVTLVPTDVFERRRDQVTAAQVVAASREDTT